MFRYLLDRLRGGCNQFRRAAAVIALCTAGVPAWGLGLGEIELDSALNEPLAARIDLVDVQGLQPVDVMVSLASAQDFQRVGVERFFFLTDLRFEVAVGDGGSMTVKVSSTQPITEPYLNFLVEVLWPSGRMLKEYTLLLDPPTFSPAPAAPVAAPARSEQAAAPGPESGRISRAEELVSLPPATRVAAPTQSSAPQAAPLDAGAVDGEYRMTDRRDTLWRIADSTRASRAVSLNQQMLAIQRLNPDAFVNGNINLLKAGHTLRLPTESEALSISDARASELVTMQNEDWRAGQSGQSPRSTVAQRSPDAAASPAALQSQVDATPERAPAAPAAAPSAGELRIVAAAGDGVAGGTIAASDERFAVVLEEQDRLSREVEELTGALAREKELASNQIAVKDRQLEVRDQQMAQLQAEVERLRQEVAAAVRNQSQNQSTTSPSLAWWQSPYVVGAGAAALVLLLALVLLQARRRPAALAADHAEPTVRAPLAGVPPVAVTGAGAGTIAATAAAAAAAAATQAPAASVVAAPSEPADVESNAAPPAATSSDVLGEAEIYVAYGRYPQAIALLSGVLQDEPYRNDVRLKLLELHAETGDRDAFELHLAELEDRCHDDVTLNAARDLRRQFQTVADEQDSAAEVGVQPGAAQAFDGAPAGVDASEALKFDDLELVEMDQAELDPVDLGPIPHAEAPQASDAAADDLDFELDLDDIDTEALPSLELPSLEMVDLPAGTDGSPNGSPAAELGGDLGGDLGIEFDPDRSAEVSPAVAASSEAALDFDLDLDLELELDSPVEQEVATLGADEFGFADDGDATSTKLDLARAYIDMGDQDGARDILSEVVLEGNPEQQRRAQAMLQEL
jgi:pilus assembly protein FimV